MTIEMNDEDWKSIVSYPKIGPAKYFNSENLPNKYKRVTMEEAKSGAPCRVYSDGAYDVFHSGHSRQLMQSKNYFPNVTLIAGVHSNKEIHRVKGQTVNTDEERLEAVRHCRYVDEVVFDVPFEYSIEFFDKYQIDFIAHDDAPYLLGGGEDFYALPKRLNMFLPTQRTEGISTSDLVTRVVKNYDGYVRRNLSRGVDAGELNVGALTFARIRTEDILMSSYQMLANLFGGSGENKEEKNSKN